MASWGDGISFGLLGVRVGSARTGIPPPLSSIYTWGSGITTPLRLPMLNTEVVQVSAGRTQKAGVTKSGRVIMWEVSNGKQAAAKGNKPLSAKEEYSLLPDMPWPHIPPVSRQIPACS